MWLLFFLFLSLPSQNIPPDTPSFFQNLIRILLRDFAIILDKTPNHFRQIIKPILFPGELKIGEIIYINKLD
jgi:hypothetical protein